MSNYNYYNTNNIQQPKNYNNHYIFNNINYNNNNNYINNIQLNNNGLYQPTFFNRLFGLPSHDEISIKKFRLNILRILVVCIVLVGVFMYLGWKNSQQRTTTILMQYENQTYLPEIYFIFLYLDTGVIDSVRVEKSNPVTQSLNDVLIDATFNIFTQNMTIQGSLSDCMFIFEDSFHLSPDCIPLYSRDIVYFNFNLNNQSTFDLAIKIGDNPFSFSDNTAQQVIGLTKSIYIDQNGDETTSYKESIGLSRPQLGKDRNGIKHITYGYGIYFYSNMILKEVVESDFDAFTATLSNMGSLLSIIITVSEIFFAYITKILIKDKSAWVDDNVRECIIYHSDQINLENIKYKKSKNINNDDNKTNDNQSNNNDNEYDDNDEEEEDGINDNQVEFENSDDEKVDENDDDNDEFIDIEDSKNNYFLLQDRSFK